MIYNGSPTIIGLRVETDRTINLPTPGRPRASKPGNIEPKVIRKTELISARIDHSVFFASFEGPES